LAAQPKACRVANPTLVTWLLNANVPYLSVTARCSLSDIPATGVTIAVAGVGDL
jgi:hypothetical protein